MDVCSGVHIAEHPGKTEIFENGVLKETIDVATLPKPIASPFGTGSIAYDVGLEEIDGQQCFTAVPIVRVERRYVSVDGEYTDREHAYFTGVETFGTDNKLVTIGCGWNRENNKREE
jgi:hypothetical protein